MANTRTIYLNTIKELTGQSFTNLDNCPNILFEFENYNCRRFTYSHDKGSYTYYLKFRMDLSYLIDREVEVFDLISNYGLQHLSLEKYAGNTLVNNKVLLNQAISNKVNLGQDSKKEIDKFNKILTKGPRVTKKQINQVSNLIDPIT